MSGTVTLAGALPGVLKRILCGNDSEWVVGGQNLPFHWGKRSMDGLLLYTRTRPTDDEDVDVEGTVSGTIQWPVAEKSVINTAAAQPVSHKHVET